MPFLEKSYKSYKNSISAKSMYIIDFKKYAIRTNKYAKNSIAIDLNQWYTCFKQKYYRFDSLFFLSVTKTKWV